MIASLSLKVVLGITAAVLIIIISFISTDKAVYLLIFAMLLSPEIIIAPSPQREISLRMDDLLILAISFGWLAKNAVYKELGLFAKTPLNRAILYYVFACVLSTFIGMVFGKVSYLSGTMFVLKYIEYFVIFFMVLHNIHSREQVRKYLLAMFSAAIIVSLYAILQIPTGERISAPFEGKLGEPNTFGGYLVLIISMMSGMFLTYTPARIKLLLLTSIGFIAIPFLYTLSRSSWMALAGMYIALLAFARQKMMLALVLIISILTFPIILPEKVEQRYRATFMEKPLESPKQVKVGGMYLDLSASERINSYLNILDDIKNRPLFGYGITGYGFIDGQYFRTLIETGLIGFSAFLYLIYKIFSTALNLYRKAKDELFKGLSLGMLAGLAALLAHSVTANTFIIIRIMEPFWLMMALVVASACLIIKNEEAANVKNIKIG